MDAFPKNLMPKKDAFPSFGRKHLVIWQGLGQCPHYLKHKKKER
jgi:hypothetical protein